jgi:hypothetical protein
MDKYSDLPSCNTYQFRIINIVLILHTKYVQDKYISFYFVFQLYRLVIP